MLAKDIIGQNEDLRSGIIGPYCAAEAVLVSRYHMAKHRLVGPSLGCHFKRQVGYILVGFVKVSDVFSFQTVAFTDGGQVAPCFFAAEEAECFRNRRNRVIGAELFT